MKHVFHSVPEPETDRRKFLIASALSIAAAAAALRQPRLKLDYLGSQKLEAVVPKSIGRWNFVAASGLVVPPEDQLEKTLYSQLLTRVYTDGESTPIMLLLAQSGAQTGFLQVHRPETCYGASGYQVSAVAPHPVPLESKLIHAERLDATAQGQTEHIVYWTRVGNRIPNSWADQKWAVAEQNLEGVIPDAILVRVSTISNDAAAAFRTVDEFIRAMLRSIPAKTRPVFIA